MNTRKAKEILVQDKNELNKTIKEMSSNTIHMFLSALNQDERRGLFRKVNVLSARKVVRHSGNNLIIDAFLNLVDHSKVIEISEKLPDWRKAQLIKLVKLKDRKKLCMLLYALRVHHLT